MRGFWLSLSVVHVLQTFCWCCVFFAPAEQFSVEVSLTAYQIMMWRKESDCESDSKGV